MKIVVVQQLLSVNLIDTCTFNIACINSLTIRTVIACCLGYQMRYVGVCVSAETSPSADSLVYMSVSMDNVQWEWLYAARSVCEVKCHITTLYNPH